MCTDLNGLECLVLLPLCNLMWMWHNLKKKPNHCLTKEVLDLSLQKEIATMIKNSTLLVKLLVGGTTTACGSQVTSVFAEWCFADNINLSLLLGIYPVLFLLALTPLLAVLLLFALIPLLAALFFLALIPLLAVLILLYLFPLVPDILLPHFWLVFSVKKEKNWISCIFV